MLTVFVDESEWPRPRVPGGYTVWAGVGIHSNMSREFFRELFNLEKRFWAVEEAYDFEIKGRLLLSERKLKSPKRREFVEEILSLCKLNNVVAFAVGLRYPETHPMPEANSPNTYQMIQSMVERVQAMMVENHPDERAIMVFDSQENAKDKERGLEFGNYLYGTAQGRSTTHVCDTPIFASSAVTKGLQIADIFAYVLAQRNLTDRNREDLTRFYDKIREMEWRTREQEDRRPWRGFRFRDNSPN